MEKEEILEVLDHIGEDTLSIHNKIQEGIKLARDGKWYYADTKLQGTRQKILNIYSRIKEIRDKIENNNENN